MTTWYNTATDDEVAHVNDYDLPHGFYTATGPGPSYVKGPFQMGPELDEDLAYARSDDPTATLLYVDGSGSKLIAAGHIAVRLDALGRSFAEVLEDEVRERAFVTAMRNAAVAAVAEDEADEIQHLREAVDLVLAHLNSRWNSGTQALERLPDPVPVQ